MNALRRQNKSKTCQQAPGVVDFADWLLTYWNCYSNWQKSWLNINIHTFYQAKVTASPVFSVAKKVWQNLGWLTDWQIILKENPPYIYCWNVEHTADCAFFVLSFEQCMSALSLMVCWGHYWSSPFQCTPAFVDGRRPTTRPVGESCGGHCGNIGYLDHYHEPLT